MKRIDWHAGFVSAMKLELVENENDLTYDEEHPVANRAQRIDLLIIKNERSARIINPIGAMFSKFNICEYKSPQHSLTYGDFYKVIAYTCLYLNETQHDTYHNAGDYTMTFVNESRPRKLFQQLHRDGIEINETIPGIYRLSYDLPFKTQVIVTSELLPGRCSWLKCLTKKGTDCNLEYIVDATWNIRAHNKKYADNVMDVFTNANNTLVKRRKEEDPDMCNAVNELFADEIKELKSELNDTKIELTDTKTKLSGALSQIAQLEKLLEEKASASNNTN